MELNGNVIELVQVKHVSGGNINEQRFSVLLWEDFGQFIQIFLYY